MLLTLLILYATITIIGLAATTVAIHHALAVDPYLPFLAGDCTKEEFDHIINVDALNKKVHEKLLA